MNKKENIKENIIEAAIVTFIMVFYIVYGINFFPLLILFIPVPFIVLGVRNGLYSNILSILLTSIIVELILGDTIGASLVFVLAPLSIAINYCIKKRKDSKQTVLISVISFLVPFMILLILGIKIADIDLISEMDAAFTEYMAMQIDGLKEMGLTNHKILKIMDQVESGYNEIIMLIPSLISVFSLFITYINYLLAGIVLRKMGYELIKRPRLSKFKLPSNVLLGVGIMLLAGFIFIWLDIQNSQALLLNITFLIGIMFMIQGLAVFDFFLKKIKMKLVFRIILIVLSIVFLPMGSLIIFLGILDSIFDMRKLRRLKS